MADQLSLRAASLDDADFLRNLRNDPAVVQASRNGRPVDEREHLDWLVVSLATQGRRLFVIFLDDVPIGQARLDDAGDGEYVSIALITARRGSGVGTRIVQELMARARGDLLAEVRTSNLGSLALFERAGFREEHRADEIVRLRWPNVRQSAGSRAEAVKWTAGSRGD